MTALNDGHVASVKNVSLRYGKTLALENLTLDFPAGCMVGIIGPDGVGKSSLLSLIAGSHSIQEGEVQVLGGDMRKKSHRDKICPWIAYMPQGLGKNLYPTLSVEENLQFFGKLFGHNAKERRHRIDELTKSTGLHRFLDRPAGKLSGGMKQKLGLCCSLIHDPKLLILDEPTTGVDPLSRNQFWELIRSIHAQRPNMSVIVATAYMEEADRFDWLVAMNARQVLATGTPKELHQRTDTNSLEDAFIALLPEELKANHSPVIISPLNYSEHNEIAIKAQGLTCRFGNFTAVDHVSFNIPRGEIFGFLGSNGCGKSTTMKMLTGLLPATEGTAWLFGKEIDSNDMEVRQRVGYMSQAFSLYTELTVRQNLELHARLFHVPAAEIPSRVDEVAERFDLKHQMEALPDNLPLGIRQRLSLAVAMVHKPELLILDEPTSGVDPIARDNFWKLMISLSRNDKVTIFISTHFMNEAERCDRMSLMHAGQVLVTDTPENIVQQRGASSLEEAFVGYLAEAEEKITGVNPMKQPQEIAPSEAPMEEPHSKASNFFSIQRCYSYGWRELLELKRDPVRAILAFVGTAILMFIMGYGINMDVENLNYAVLDQDQSTLSHNYALSLSGSRYFTEKPPILDYQDMDKRLRSGELALALEIPPSFAKKVLRGDPTQIAAWVDGAMPQRAETVLGYVQGIHQNWGSDFLLYNRGETPPTLGSVVTRYRYNPDVKSLPAMVPGVIPLLLLMIPAILTALSVVREKELGSILNFYTTPVTRSEFLIGKQIPYVLLGIFNFLLLCFLAIVVFQIPIKGSFLALFLGAVIYLIIATAMGLLASLFTQSQIAAIFVAMMGTVIPASQFSGLTTPVSSLEGAGALIGHIFPTTHYLTISRGVFNKALDITDLYSSFIPLLIIAPVLMITAILLLKKQES